MNTLNYPVYIDLEKLKRNNLICDEKSYILHRQFLEVCRIIKCLWTHRRIMTRQRR